MEHLYILLFFIFLGSVTFLYYNKTRRDEELEFIKHYEHYMAILVYHMEKAFEIIYKEKIMVYSLEAMKINDFQFKSISKDFGVLVLKMIGPGLKKSFINMYGSEETLLFNIMEYFNTRFESDEIYKTTTDNMVSSDEKDNFWDNLTT